MVAHGGRYESYAPVGCKYSNVQKFKSDEFLGLNC